jgi:2-hydroxychromene-2-carboxylate isomerase
MRDWDLEVPFIEAIFKEYWELDNGEIGEYSQLRLIAERLGIEGAVFEATAESDRVRNALIHATNQGREQGVFGAPSMMLAGELYWGKDRFEFLEDHLSQLASAVDEKA